MRDFKPVENDPVEIGVCAGCGQPIYSNEDHWLDGVNMIHAEGAGARVKVIGTELWKNVSCLFLYLNEEMLDNEVAEAMKIERVEV